MVKDILFKSEDLVFSYRVGGIIIRDGKVLLQKPVNDDYAIIGGHVTSMEESKNTLIREYEEELHCDIVVDKLAAVGEIFFDWGNRPCHQICLYYLIHLADERQIPLTGTFHGYDELDNERIDLDFCWVPLEELANIKVYPLGLLDHILENDSNVYHFVYREEEEL